MIFCYCRASSVIAPPSASLNNFNFKFEYEEAQAALVGAAETAASSHATKTEFLADETVVTTDDAATVAVSGGRWERGRRRRFNV